MFKIGDRIKCSCGCILQGIIISIGEYGYDVDTEDGVQPLSKDLAIPHTKPLRSKVKNLPGEEIVRGTNAKVL